MIEMAVKDYCHSCPEFEATSSKHVLWANDEPELVSVLVKCKHEEKCKHIMKNAERILRGKAEAEKEEEMPEAEHFEAKVEDKQITRAATIAAAMYLSRKMGK